MRRSACTRASLFARRAWQGCVSEILRVLVWLPVPAVRVLLPSCAFSTRKPEPPGTNLARRVPHKKIMPCRRAQHPRGREEETGTTRGRRSCWAARESSHQGIANDDNEERLLPCWELLRRQPPCTSAGCKGSAVDNKVAPNESRRRESADRANGGDEGRPPAGRSSTQLLLTNDNRNNTRGG